MGNRPEISPSEWQVMNVVWELQPVTANAIIDRLAKANDWTPATVRTFLHRLVKKQALAFTKDGNRYLYRAAITRASTIKQASRSFLSSVFGGETSLLLTHFVKAGKLSEDDIQTLRNLLEEKESQG